MDNSPTIADTGIIVGLIDSSDQWHAWVKEQAGKFSAPYLTCEAVICEACHLLKGARGGASAVYRLLASDALEIAFDLSAEVERTVALADKYKDLPMDFADACLVRMSEIYDAAKIFTLDSDFWLYRKSTKRQIPLIIPDKI